MKTYRKWSEIRDEKWARMGLTPEQIVAENAAVRADVDRELAAMDADAVQHRERE